jgi:hypothetical protein
MRPKPDRLHVAGHGRIDPAGADHGLDEERRHTSGAEPLDLGAQRVGRVVRDDGGARDERAVAGPVGVDPGDRRPERHRAVVAADPADDLDAVGLAVDLPVEAGELRRRVDRVAAAAGEEDLRVVHRRAGGEEVGDLERRRGGDVAEDRVRLEPRHLLGDGVDDLAAAVADVAVPEARGGVEVAVAVLVVDPHSLAAVDDELVAADGGHVRERMPEPGVGASRHADSLPGRGRPGKLHRRERLT